MNIPHDVPNKKSKFIVKLVDGLRMLSIIWIFIVLIFFKVVTGDGTFGGGQTSSTEETGFSVGILMAISLLVMTILTFKTSLFTKILSTFLGMIIFHAVLFGIYG
jgi:hypothetical protein